MNNVFRKAAPVRPIPAGIQFFPFLAWLIRINRASLRADLLAGLTGAFIVLPQGVSFAMIAGLPPQYGLYAAIVPPIIAALFGSSRHLVSGPTTAISIIVFSTLSPLAAPGSADYVRLALTLTFMAGLFQFVFGLIRLGTLINFVSHSVIVGFSAGAALLIATSQLKHALGVPVPSGSSFLTTWAVLIQSHAQINYYELCIALISLGCAIAVKAWKPRLPALLFALITGALFSLAIDGQGHGVRFLGELNGQLPQISAPDFTLDTLRLMAPGALAVAFLGLIEALSIARSIAVQSGQHIDGNQEFIGQGLSNIAGSFFSGYASSGSFTRSGVNYDSGAVSPLASIFSALFLMVIVLLVAPLTAYLPLSAMGGAILFVAFKLIDVRHIKEILKSSRPDTMVLIATFTATLFFAIEFAIYSGILLSMAIYLTRTSHPHVTPLTPDPLDDRRTLINARESDSPPCPQLTMLQIHGSLFFGAANHVAQALEEIDGYNTKHLLIVGYAINFIDVSGAMVLVQEAMRRRKLGKNLYLCRINADVEHFLIHGEFMDKIGKSHLFKQESQAISSIYKRLDPTICNACNVRIFRECPTDPTI